MAIPEEVTEAGSPAPLATSAREDPPVGLLIVDREGGVRQTSSEMNRLLGRPIQTLSEPLEDSDRFPSGQVLTLLRESLEQRRPITRLVFRDGRSRVVAIVRTAVSHDATGGLRLTGVVMDLTEALAQADLAGDFLRQVRHDLRGPLTSLRGAVDLLRSGRLSGQDERQERLLDLMDKAADQLVELVSAGAASSSGSGGSQAI